MSQVWLSRGSLSHSTNLAPNRKTDSRSSTSYQPGLEDSSGKGDCGACSMSCWQPAMGAETDTAPARAPASHQAHNPRSTSDLAARKPFRASFVPAAWRAAGPAFARSAMGADEPSFHPQVLCLLRSEGCQRNASLPHVRGRGGSAEGTAVSCCTTRPGCGSGPLPAQRPRSAELCAAPGSSFGSEGDSSSSYRGHAPALKPMGKAALSHSAFGKALPGRHCHLVSSLGRHPLPAAQLALPRGCCWCPPGGQQGQADGTRLPATGQLGNPRHPTPGYQDQWLQLEYRVQFWAPHSRRASESCLKVQPRARKMERVEQLSVRIG